MRDKKTSLPVAMVAALFIAALTTATPATSQTEKTLYNFIPGGSDGIGPLAGVIFDTEGDLYGTTSVGGAYNHGTVFELTPKAGAWTEKILHSFGGGQDGIDPFGEPLLYFRGNLYGTTYTGGKYNQGVVFELAPEAGGRWKESILHSFAGGTDGCLPSAGLVANAGNLYGTTYSCGASGYGTAFELSPAAGVPTVETILHNFAYNGTDGTNPAAALTFDTAGNIYGTTSYGGIYTSGTVFQLTPGAEGTWQETILHNFQFNGTDGGNVDAPVILDASGNVYGTTNQGGTSEEGVIFELSPGAGGEWVEKILYTFANFEVSGANPSAPVVGDSSGNLFGTTDEGGGRLGVAGVVFELTRQPDGEWTETVLYTFGAYNRDPVSGLIFDARGNLYGTSGGGGSYLGGFVFEIKP